MWYQIETELAQITNSCTRGNLVVEVIFVVVQTRITTRFFLKKGKIPRCEESECDHLFV